MFRYVGPPENLTDKFSLKDLCSSNNFDQTTLMTCHDHVYDESEYRHSFAMEADLAPCQDDLDNWIIEVSPLLMILGSRLMFQKKRFCSFVLVMDIQSQFHWNGLHARAFIWQYLSWYNIRPVWKKESLDSSHHLVLINVFDWIIYGLVLVFACGSFLHRHWCQRTFHVAIYVRD